MEFNFPGCQQGTAEFALQIPVTVQPHLTLVLMETRERGRGCMSQCQVLDVAQTAKDKELIQWWKVDRGKSSSYSGKKKKNRRTRLPGADCTRTPRQGVQGAWHGAVHAARLWLGGTFITKLEDSATSSLTSSLMAQCLHHPDSRALKPRGISLSSHWTKITGSLGFILPGRPEACTNPSLLICNKALQRQHHL